MNEIEQVYAKLKRLANSQGVDLDGGNCGAVALAIKQYLKHLDLRIGFITNENDFDDLFSDPDIYHVYIIDVAAQRYDSTGKIDENYLLKFAEEEYGDSEPIEWVLETPEEVKSEKQLVYYNTAHSQDISYFFNLLQDNLVGERKVIFKRVTL